MEYNQEKKETKGHCKVLQMPIVQNSTSIDNAENNTVKYQAYKNQLRNCVIIP